MITVYAGMLLLIASVALGNGATKGILGGLIKRNGGEDFIFEFCASDFNPGDEKTHLLANLDSNGRTLLRWVPYSTIDLIIDELAGTLTLSGDLIPLGAYNHYDLLTINFVYSDPVFINDCFCSSEDFAGNFYNPNYKKIEKKCDLRRFMNRDDQSLLFCPTCEDNQCRVANKNRNQNGAPKPIYDNWIFFETVSGSLSGPGLTLFREKVVEGFPSFYLDVAANCTPDITNLPLPQVFCTDFFDPENAFGYGVNGKNQNCGMSSWFNCQEDVYRLGGDQLTHHVADINLNIVPCPPV